METTGLISSLSAAIWAPSAQFQPGKTWFPFVVVLFILEKKKEKAGTNKTTFPHIDTGVLFYNQIPLTHCKTLTPKPGTVNLQDILLTDGRHTYDLSFAAPPPTQGSGKDSRWGSKSVCVRVVSWRKKDHKAVS